MSLLQVRPARTTPKGRACPPEYLQTFTYPGLLSGGKVEVVTTRDPEDARVYLSPDSVSAALELLRVVGFPETVEVPS